MLPPGGIDTAHAPPPDAEDKDPLLVASCRRYKIAERHHIRVAAPAAVTLDVAREVDLQAAPVVRTVIRAREVILGAIPTIVDVRVDSLPRSSRSGGAFLAEVAGREIVVGAVTKPWEANVTFRALPTDQFAASDEPGYVKICR